jgi:hypothetical protein
MQALATVPYQGDFGFTQFGKDLFDSVTQTWHEALLSARP